MFRSLVATYMRPAGVIPRLGLLARCGGGLEGITTLKLIMARQWLPLGKPNDQVVVVVAFDIHPMYPPFDPVPPQGSYGGNREQGQTEAHGSPAERR